MGAISFGVVAIIVIHNKVRRTDDDCNISNEVNEKLEIAKGAFDLEVRMGELAEEYELTEREKELAKFIYNGKSNAEISKELFISESTVKTHIYNIFRKMDIKNRIQLVCLIRGEQEEKAC